MAPPPSPQTPLPTPFKGRLEPGPEATTQAVITSPIRDWERGRGGRGKGPQPLSPLPHKTIYSSPQALRLWAIFFLTVSQVSVVRKDSGQRLTIC